MTVGQFDQILRSRKGFGGSLEAAQAPDTNVNRATRVRTLDTIIAPLTLLRTRAPSPVLAYAWHGQGYARLSLAKVLLSFHAYPLWRTFTGSPVLTISPARR